MFAIVLLGGDFAPVVARELARASKPGHTIRTRNKTVSVRIAVVFAKPHAGESLATSGAFQEVIVVVITLHKR